MILSRSRSMELKVMNVAECSMPKTTTLNWKEEKTLGVLSLNMVRFVMFP